MFLQFNATQAAAKARAPAQAQSQAQPKIRMGRVKHDGASVYRAADFDAQVITTLPQGKTYPISSKVVGPFYKIKVKDGVYGYIADTDVAPILTESEKRQKAKEKAGKDREEKPKKRKAFEWERDRGISISRINYREETMGLRPTEAMTFFGAKFSGVNTLMEGLYIDSNIQIAPQAPNYYKDATGHSATGFILLMDMMFQTAMPQGKDTLSFWGFGPMLKYSKFNTTITVNGKDEAYDLTDISVGAVFNAGIAQRVGSVVLRGELKYYWEKMQYLGFGVAVQLPF